MWSMALRDILWMTRPDDYQERRMRNDEVFLPFKLDFDCLVAKENRVITLPRLERDVLHWFLGGR